MNAYTRASVLPGVGTMSRAVAIIGLIGCSRPVAFESDDPIVVLAPAARAPAAVVKDGAIVVVKQIEFGPSAEITPGTASVLDEVVSLSRQNPTIKTIVVEHAELASPRREALLAYLVQHGVPVDIEVTP